MVTRVILVFVSAVRLPAVQESDDCPSSSAAISSDDLTSV